uniref:Uncharacterized protein n=1 Tax=Globisporangium ultimum (strain ATCC 200006 / CBS 805.95 / DAOM BR144) TaxID=431595 RepID=K3XBU0_GLOUD
MVICCCCTGRKGPSDELQWSAVSDCGYMGI